MLDLHGQQGWLFEEDRAAASAESNAGSSDEALQFSRFESVFRSLNPVEQAVAIAFGVVFPHSLTRDQMSEVLLSARFRIRRRLILEVYYEAACTSPLEAGILLDPGEQGSLVACEDWAPWLTRQAHWKGMLNRIEQSFSHVYSRGREHEDGDAITMMLARNCTVAGEFDQMRYRLGNAPPGAWGWLSRPGFMGLLERLPDQYKEAAYRDCISEVVRRAEAPEAVINIYAESSVNLAAKVADMAMFEAMRGSLDKALAVFDQLQVDERATKSVRIEEASARAMIAMLRGDDAEAAVSIEEAIKCERIGTRKRNVIPKCAAFSFALLALIRGHKPECAAKLDHLLNVAKKDKIKSTFLHVVKSAYLIREDHDTALTYSFGFDSFDVLVDGLLSCWKKKFPGPAGERHFTTLLNFGTKAARNGYRWVAAECFEVCTQWWRADGREESEIQETLARILGQEESGPSEVASGMHKELGTVSLASLISPQAKWNYALQRIERVAHEAKGKASKRNQSPTTKEQRLVWVLQVGKYETITFRCKVQRGTRNGQWTKGRIIPLKTLRERRAEMDFLTNKDRAAAGKIVFDRNIATDEYGYTLPRSGLYELAGHQYIFNKAGESVEIVRCEPELHVQEQDGSLLVSVNPHVEIADDENLLCVCVSDTRIEVTRFTSGHRKLCRIIPSDGLELPSEAKNRLIGAVSTLAQDMRVQGLIAGEAEVVSQVDGDPWPWVRLEPSGQGLIVTLLVEPVPESGKYFQPGAGGNTAFASVAGKTVQARRTHAAETNAVRELTLTCPMLEGAGPGLSLAVPEPSDCIELVDQLDAAGARCLWPHGQPYRVVARADTGTLRLQVKSAADWFSTTGELPVNKDRVLELHSLFELMDQNPQSRFVPVGEGAFVSLTSSFRRQLEDLRSLSSSGGKKGLRIHGLAALSLREFFENVQLAADDEWVSLQDTFDDARSFEPVVPGTLQAELRPYQEDGFRWLARLGHWGVGACLADDMGLGKTIQALTLLLDRAPKGPALVVAPTSVVDNWINEARRFAPTLNVRTYTGSPHARARHLEDLGPFDLVVTTYGLLHIDADPLGSVDWGTTVLDEAQAIRNPSTKRARAARKLKAGFRVVTTGTPIQNNLGDLYSLFAFLNPGMLGSRKHFREKFELPIVRDGDPATRNRLRRLISAFMLRRIKADVLDDLPPRTEVTLHVKLSPEEATLYEALRQRAMEDLQAIGMDRTSDEEDVEPEQQRRFQILAHLTRLRLACCNPRLVHPDGPSSSKMQTFAATLTELRKGRHKVLVFSQFVRHLKLIEEHLVEAGIPYQYLDGSTPAKARSQRIAAFQAGEGDVFLISLKAGGVGLNLTAADYVIHMDPWWNPAAEDQASDRAHRIGQTRPVTIYRLVTKGTIEEQIVQLHHSKRELADRLLEGTDTPARLNTEELLKLLTG